MKAKDVMTRHVICVRPEASVREAVQLMLENKISGLPVVDNDGVLVGIVSEGDFLRRAETGTTRTRPRWLQFIAGPGKLADDYVHAHGRKVEEVMTGDVLTVIEDDPLENIVGLMEKYHVKRVPVMRGDRIAGIVTRANLLRALAGVAEEIAPGPGSDEIIRDRVAAELARQSWAPRNMIDITVRKGVVELWGTVLDPRQRDAARVVAESVPGVNAVKSHVTWVEPMSGMAFPDPAEEVGATAASAAPTKQKKSAVTA